MTMIYLRQGQLKFDLPTETDEELPTHLRDIACKKEGVRIINASNMTL